MASTIDTRPQVVNINHLSGNTLTIKVRTPVLYAVGLEWSAQVRSLSTSTTADADFTITTGTSTDPEVAIHYVSLSSSQTTHLCEDLGTLITVREKGSTKENTIKRYIGRYDIQVAGIGGVDPVITLGTGELLIDLDVTRDA